MTLIIIDFWEDLDWTNGYIIIVKEVELSKDYAGYFVFKVYFVAGGFGGYVKFV